MTTRAAVVGQPIAHSLSPLLHGAWIEAAGLDAGYEAHAPAASFAAMIAELRAKGFAGVNVTIPFKEEALALSDVASDRATGAGAANLLVFTPEGVRADNTDGFGLLAALAEQAPAWRPQAGPVVILGAGGAAKGAAFALREAGAPRVTIVNRTLERARDMAAALGSNVEACAWDQAKSALPAAALLVNATALGLGGGEGPDVDLSLLPKGAVVMDMVYKPLRTEFLERSAALGLTTVDGLAMLIGQAKPSFEAFFGRSPPADIDVRALLLKKLEGA